MAIFNPTGFFNDFLEISNNLDEFNVFDKLVLLTLLGELFWNKLNSLSTKTSWSEIKISFELNELFNLDGDIIDDNAEFDALVWSLDPVKGRMHLTL